MLDDIHRAIMLDRGFEESPVTGLDTDWFNERFMYFD